MQTELLLWLMESDPGGAELPDFADLIRRPEWFAEAACRGSGPASYFPGKGGTASDARAVCATCPADPSASTTP